jgi:hypothetical protein
VVTRNGEAVVEIAIAASTEVNIDQVRGDESNHLGWWSNQLEAREPSWLIGGVAHGAVPMVMATIIRPWTEEEPSIAGPTVSQAGSVITTSWCSVGNRRTAIIDRSRPGQVEFRSLPTSTG